MDKKFITLETVKESLDLMRIDSEGLDDMDRKYMNCIIKNFSGGLLELIHLVRHSWSREISLKM